MPTEIRILGWLDPDMPGRWKDAGPCEFRLKLSESPSSSWKKSFRDHGDNQSPSEVIEQDIMLLTCELNEIEGAIVRIGQRLDLTNQTVGRLEREADERVVVQKQADEEKRNRILAAVSNIHFHAR